MSFEQRVQVAAQRGMEIRARLVPSLMSACEWNDLVKQILLDSDAAIWGEEDPEEIIERLKVKLDVAAMGIDSARNSLRAASPDYHECDHGGITYEHRDVCNLCGRTPEQDCPGPKCEVCGEWTEGKYEHAGEVNVCSKCLTAMQDEAA